MAFGECQERSACSFTLPGALPFSKPAKASSMKNKGRFGNLHAQTWSATSISEHLHYASPVETPMLSVWLCL
jgi:hypothetical protein